MRKKRIYRRKIKNFILKGITYLAIIVGSVSGCLLDSENFIFFVLTMLVCITWIVLFLIANE